MKPRSKTEYIVIHCADTYETMDIGAEDIRKWHVEERGWSDIGYHKVIRRDGTVETGRDIDVSGAHAAGFNSVSIGVCLVGGRGEDDEADSIAFDSFAAKIASMTHFKLSSDFIFEKKLRAVSSAESHGNLR